jgi:hypothetical protein
MLFHFLVYNKHSLDRGRLTWRHDYVLNHIPCCLKSVPVVQSTDKLYCDLEGLQVPGCGSIPTDILAQAQRPDLVILDQLMNGQHRIALVELTCPWTTDAPIQHCSVFGLWAHFCQAEYCGLDRQMTFGSWPAQIATNTPMESSIFLPHLLFN